VENAEPENAGHSSKVSPAFSDYCSFLVLLFSVVHYPQLAQRLYPVVFFLVALVTQGIDMGLSSTISYKLSATTNHSLNMTSE